MRLQELAGPLDIPFDLPDQLLRIFEFHLVADPVDEEDLDRLPVQLLPREIQQMDLHGQPVVAEGRAVADVQDAGMPPAFHLGRDGIHPAGRDEFLLRGDVRRGHPDLGAPPVALHDGAAQVVGPAQELHGPAHIPFLQGVPDAGAAHEDALDLHALDGLHVEPQLFAHAAQERLVARLAVPEGRVVADDELLEVEPVPEDAPDELLGRRLRELRGEFDEDDRIDAQAFDQLQLLLERRQEIERASLGVQDLLGVGLEGQDDAAALPVGGLRDDLPQKPLVREVDPVEVADGHDGTLVFRGDLVQAPDDIHETLRLSDASLPARPVGMPALYHITWASYIKPVFA